MIDVEFVEAKAPGRMRWLVLAAACLAALLTWVANAWTARQLKEIDESARSAQELASPDGAGRQAAQRARAIKNPAYEASARDAFRQGQFPGQQALAALEMVVVRGISLDALTVAGSTVQVELRATNEPTLRDYLDHLNAGMPRPVWSIASTSTVIDASSTSLRVRLLSNWSD